MPENDNWRNGVGRDHADDHGSDEDIDDRDDDDTRDDDDEVGQSPVPSSLVSVPVWSDIPDPYNLTVGESFYLYLNGYVTGSYAIGDPTTMRKSGGRIPAGLSFNSGVLSGTVTTVESPSLQFESTNSAGSTKSEWIEFRISSAVPGSETPSSSTSPATPSPPPTVSLPVWSDIPDPYNLIVGVCFYLDLSRYVTGDPTFTRNGGAIPAGLSFSSGVLSGTVTTVESRSIRFTATNSAGSADSEWIRINVTAP